MNDHPVHPIVTRVSDVAPQRVEWLWPGRLPFGKVTVLDGDPGLGKSTVALAVMGALGTEAHVAGEVRFRGESLVGRPERELRRLWGRRLAMVFQDPTSTLNPVLTVGDQLVEVLVEHEGIGVAAARARTAAESGSSSTGRGAVS